MSYIASFTTESYLLTTWFGFDIAVYFNMWCRQMFRFGCQQYMFTTLRCMLWIILLLFISNLWQIFSKCSFRRYSTYFHSTLYPSFRRKISALNFPQITRSQLSAFRVPQNIPSRDGHTTGHWPVALFKRRDRRWNTFNCPSLCGSSSRF